MSKQDTKFAQTHELEQRIARLEREHHMVSESVKALERGRDEAIAAGDDEEAQLATKHLAMQREQLAGVEGGLQLLQQRLPETREAEGRSAATERLRAIEREGQQASVAYGRAVANLVAQARAFVEARAQVIDTFKKTGALKAEGDALRDRFKQPAPKLPTVIVPAVHPAFREVEMSIDLPDHGFVPQATQRCEFGLRMRRSYREVSSSEGYAIISRAGLVPWPELTERQREIIAERERDAERERKVSQQMRDEAATVPHEGRRGILGRL